ncbi:DUF4430 domain-containing protein [Collinsella sp. AM10-11]|nr:DUF4430 domain-containing protein [Collinsella sp. AM10-48]RHJ38915.1 DUF4430 domain-containing protein [Collinsella sp. AM10-32]RHJ44509.1 DUF4430 domain-containing protein [Collinsella sp. AM10-26]RHJ45251.1 DUF4430 domain-containing protein [Collinsella sp. AM10-27]RHJ55626.1 DUF4430 domain-containing protein [Collinsella sp. AM10-11]
MGVLERNMRDDVGQPQGNASSTDNGGQMDMFEDERERASLHRRGAIARGVAKRGLVAFLAFAMVFGTMPAQLWAEGAEGIAEAVAQAATPSEGAGAAGGTADQGKAEVSDSGSAPAASADTTEAATGDEGSATGESPATSEQSSTASAGQAGSAAAAAVQTENPTETGDVAKKQVEVSFSIIGTDADGKAQTWVAPTQLKLDEGSTAADAFVKLQQKVGFKAKYDPNTAYGFHLESITSPSDGRTLAFDPATYAYWQLFVDGASSSVGASGVKLTQGQKIEFAYTAGSSSPVVKDQVAANVTVIGRDAQGKTQTWVDNAQYVVTSGSSALDLTKVALEANDIDAVAAGSFILSLKYNGVELGTPLDYSTYWQLFINGKSSDYTADNVTIHAGDTVTWFYGGWGDQLPSDSVHASVQVLGKDKDGKQQVWASTGQMSLKVGSTAKDLLEQTGLRLDSSESSWGWFLNGIYSPFDVDGKPYVGDAATNSYWRFYVNGEFKNVGAGAYELQEGDAVTFMYGADADALPGQVLGSVDVIGPDVNGNNTRWGSASNVSLPEGSTAQNLIETVLKAKGVTYDGSQNGEYWFLNSIKSPFEDKAYGYDGATKKNWHLYINGEPSLLCANQITLKSGDKVTLAYTTDDSPMPDPDKIVVDPSATTPDWDAEWAGYGNSGNGSTVTDAKTPVQAAGLKWAFDWKAESGQQYANCSEPVIANGFVYIATENELIKIDSSTGKKVASAPLASKVSYTSRPIYTNGLIIVPLNGGAVQAITADKLICKWLTPGLTDLTQSSCTVVSDGEYVYVGSVDISYDENYNATYGNGSFACIKIATGEVSWQNIDPAEGYYWTGAALTDKYAIVPTSAGTLKCIDKTTGDVVSTMKLSAVANADCIADPSNGSTFYQMTHDGKLHVISLSAKGVLSEQNTVDLGLTNNLSAPAVSGDNLIVGGQTATGSALVLYNLKTGKTTMVAAADGKALPAGLNGIAATPLVSVQGGKTYVYFTVNSADSKDYVNYSAGGGVYRYTLGDAEATQIYDAAGHYQHCDSPVIADASGNLYYINDSGTLFKLGAVESWTVAFNSNGGSACDTKFVATADGKLVKPADPTRDGYTFGGWYADEACMQAYDFSTPVTADLTLYAKWTKNATNPGGNGGAGSNGGSGSGTGTGSGAGAGAGSGSGSKGGAIAPGHKPTTKTTVSTKTETKDNKSDKKSDSKSDTGAASTTTAKKSSGASEQEAGTNPLAIVGVAAGVIGLAIVGVFVFTKRR